MALTTSNHDRDAAGMRYVYPVVSRRARGVSLGINLNPNQACNWRCVYCQVPNLTRGAGPEIDLELLRRELTTLLTQITAGDWLTENAPEGARRLNDVAFSGDGEPTTSPQFVQAIGVVEAVLASFGLLGQLALVLITNGSQVHKAPVQEGLRHLARLGGEVWFKWDSGTREGRARWNDANVSNEQAEERLRLAAELAPVRLQTIAMAWDGRAPSDAQRGAWIDSVLRVQAAGANLRDVLLYGLARPSHQPEAPRLSALPVEWLEGFAAEIRRATGLEVSVSP
ncbi:MAG: radical SAM protein [Planctomycetota bacterium]|nr:radical SAM protein [Planctomycetota bacterium]